MSQNNKRRQTRRNKIYVPSMKTLARKACPPGMIEKRGYVRKYSSAVRQKGFTVKRATGTTYRVFPKNDLMHVNPVCIENTGRPGKGVPKSIGPLRKGELSKYGYSFRLKGDERREALRRSIEEYGPLGVFRKLDAVTKLTKLTLPEASAIYKKNRNWIHSTYGPLKEPTVMGANSTRRVVKNKAHSKPKRHSNKNKTKKSFWNFF